MLLLQEQKSDIHDGLDESPSDLPPAYDTLPIRQPGRSTGQRASSSAFPGPIAGPSNGPPADPVSASLNRPILHIDKSLPPHPPSLDDTPSSPRNARSALAQGPRPRKNTSWRSYLPFVSSFSAKRVRQSVSSIVSDLVVPQPRVSSEEQKNVYEIFASIAETCTEHKLSLSTILQEVSIADHTPMYWAIVNYRQELLVALLAYSRPLSFQTVSDIRRACLVSSNQALFHTLRVRRPPFHRTDGIQVPSLRVASENLLLGNRPLDEIHIQQTSDQAFVVYFDIPLWQRRMKVIGQVGVEFIASGRMWSITFFATDPSSPIAVSGKLRKGADTWHVMVTLLESSPPTFFNSQLLVDIPPPLAPKPVMPIQAQRVREARSTTFPTSRDKQHLSRHSMYDYNYDGKAHPQSSRDQSVPALSKDVYSPFSSSRPPPPTHPLRGSPSSPRLGTATPPPISVHLGSCNRKLGRRPGSGEFPNPMEAPTMKPDTWSDQGVGYTNAVVAPLGEGLARQLLHDRSRYLFPDGTLRARLEARLVKSETSKDCIIC